MLWKEQSSIRCGPTQELTTLQGQDLKLMQQHGISQSVKINDANIISADVKADNGVIHVIDKVLLPNKIIDNQLPHFSIFL